MTEKRRLNEDEEDLLGPLEEENPPENTGDTPDIGSKTQETLERLAESMLSMNKAIEQLSTRVADTAKKPHKKSRTEQIPDSGSGEESDSSLDEDSLLNKNSKQSEKGDLLEEIAMELEVDEDTDTDVSEKLAKIVNKRWTEKLNSDKLTEKLKKHPRPGNLTAVIAPKVNPEIWAVMSNQVKREDLRRVNVQTNIAKVGSVLAKCTEQLLKAYNEAKNTKDLKLDELISLHTDALALLGTANVELSLQRRDAILDRTLKKEYAGLRSQNIPITSYLFGDDLQQQLKNIKASNSLTQAASTSHASKGKGYQRREHDSAQWNHRGRQWKSRDPKNARFPPYKKKEGGQKN